MSKPESGLFEGTKGSGNFYGNAEKIIAERVKGLDLTPHPITQKQLSSKQKVRIRGKIKARTATKEEYKRLQWDKRFSRRKKDGIKHFWIEERERVKQGKSLTRNWSNQQINEIRDKMTPAFQFKPLEAHHTYSAKDFPHLANLGAVIYPATHNEHLKGWHGGNYKKSRPGKRIRRIRDF